MYKRKTTPIWMLNHKVYRYKGFGRIIVLITRVVSGKGFPGERFNNYAQAVLALRIR